MDRLLVICPSGYFAAAMAAGFDLRVKAKQYAEAIALPSIPNTITAD
jgi:hypothetical protein